MIGKRLGSAYRSRRSNDWIKLKCQLRQEFVIVGYHRAEGLSPAYRRLAARPLQPLTRSAGCAMPARSAAASPRPA
ncbi:hypothetical protein ACPA9J_18585 [Pseudomonas aeruginosa]